MTAVDGQQLLDLARRKTAQSRSALAEVIGDMFNGGGSSLSDRERALMFDILRKVVREVEASVRQALSERLATRADAPHDLVKMLANDEAGVAYPVLTRSPILRDRDLIEVIRHRTLEHQLAVAVRYTVSEDVSRALVDTGEESVIKALLNNGNAAIAQDTLAYLVEESRRVDSFQEPILARQELGADLAKRMFLWVSAALREHIIEHFDLDNETVDDLMEEAALAAAETSVEPETEGGADKLARDLDSHGFVTPDMLIDALHQGEVGLFVALFARLTGLRRTLVMRILFEPGGEGLAIACRAVGIEREPFADLYTLTRKARPRALANGDAERRRVLTLFDNMSEAGARQVLRKWQRDADYLAAIRELEVGAA